MSFSSFQAEIESCISAKISSFNLLGGGDISETYRVNTDDHRSFFFKLSHGSSSFDMYCKERDALRYLSENTIFRTPKVYKVLTIDNSSGLLLEWIDRKIANQDEMETFGIQLADMHQISQEKFGWTSPNYIGNLAQSNNQMANWADFYIDQRIEPLLKKAVDDGIFGHGILGKINNLFRAVEKDIPEESPSLLHGDLWSGNFIISAESTAVLIDPAIYFGHREMDLAMSLMFGSFGRVFYESYQSIYPLEKGFESRLPLLQLYPLLVHAILFQGQYIGKVESILSRH